MKFYSLLFCGITALIACSHLEERDTASSEAVPELTLVVASHRELELEPCGCSILALGGMDREENVIDQWKRESHSKKFLVLNSGTTFVPLFKTFKPAHLSYYTKKGLFEVEGLNALGVAALAPSIDDFMLGKEGLKQLQSKAKFSFITTNLYSATSHAPLFERYKEFDFGKVSVLVLGLSRAKSLFPIAEKIETVDPVKAIKDTLASLPPKNRLVVALVTLPKEDRDRIRREAPEVNVVVGGEENESTFQLRQYVGTQLYLNPMSRGRAVAKIAMQFPQGKPGKFYNANTSALMADVRKQSSFALADIETQLQKKKLNKKARASLLLERERINQELNDALTFPEMTSSVTQYFSETVNLEDRFQTPANAVSKIVDRFKKDLRDVALEGDR
jgi:2',3'-cyclic-nucleotide 2'-phosphodiesterase (5'-nucleotidase family)